MKVAKHFSQASPAGPGEEGLHVDQASGPVVVSSATPQAHLRRKKTIALRTIVAVVSLVLLTGLSAADDTAAIRVEIEQIGNSVDAHILVDSDEFINLVDVILHYDPTALQPHGVSSFGTRFTFGAVEDLAHGRGLVRVIRGEPHPTAPRGANMPFCTFDFTVIDPDGNHSIEVLFTGAGLEGGSSVFKDDGVPTDILKTVAPEAVWADLSVSIEPEQQTLPYLGIVTFQVTAANAGPNSAIESELTTNIPPELTALTWTCQGNNGGNCPPGGSGPIDEEVDLPPGATVTFTLSAENSVPASGTVTVEVMVKPPNAVADPFAGNNKASAQISVDTAIFSDDFEFGHTGAWSAVVGLSAP